MIIENGFKVVRLASEDRLRSAVAFLEQARVFYPQEEWVTYNLGCGPLTVFLDLPSAEDFFQMMDCVAIPLVMFECQYERVEGNSIWFPSTLQDVIGVVRNHKVMLVNLPIGTILAKRVKLGTRII